MSRDDDELAETAAADAFAQTSAVDADPLGQTATNIPSTPVSQPATQAKPSTQGKAPREQLGRLRMEGVIGRGGMGSVYAAYDPDLERRVAVKLLHAADADARARLLREARAMAKLDHPNVITVFDVGSVEGQDFVTMELVDGETLKDWLARERPSWRTIVEAFVLAGRGLAAAHHEGLVHRDFKPANVLRSKRGKIVVTDFGLSRAAADDPVEHATTLPASRRGIFDSGPTTRTQTGAVLGTPAYMAPEQWTGVNVGPASDQFAFSVALAEALDGKRPFVGDSFDALRKAVFAGPGALDGVPRQVRAIVRRGLAVDPAARWPSMADMLDRLERALHRRRRNLRLAAACTIGLAGAASILFTRSDAPVDSCAIEVPASVWSAARAEIIAKRDPAAAKLIGERVDAWRTSRVAACHEPTVRAAKLACLDGTLARIELVARAVEAERAAPATTEGTASLLLDPAVCLRDTPPRLANPIPPDLAVALAELRTVRDGGTATSPLVTSPCARALQLRTRLISINGSTLDVAGLSAMMQSLKEAYELAERCSDDEWVRASVLTGLLRGLGSARPHAELAVASAGDPTLAVELDLARTDTLGADRFDDVRAILDHAVATYGPTRPRSQIRAVGTLVEHLLERSTTADLNEAIALVSTWRGRGIELDAHALDAFAARARWRLGDVAAADAAARSSGRVYGRLAGRFAGVPQFDLTGVVVDPTGAPVANAEVSASPLLDSDSHDAASPAIDDVPIQRTRTAADGSFAIAKARGLVVASSGDHGERRSEFAQIRGQPVRLVVQPTSRVTGTVKLAGLDPARFRVMLELDRKDAQYDSVAPIRADGTFELDHVLRGPAHVFASEYDVPFGTQVHIDTTSPVSGIVVEAHAARPLWIIARNTGVTPADMAVVFVFSGHIADAHPSLATLHRNPITETQAGTVSADAVPPAARAQLQPDDLFGSIAARPLGPLSVCSAGIAREYFTKLKTSAGMRQAFSTAELGCTDVTDDDVVVVEVPPMRKLKLP